MVQVIGQSAEQGLLLKTRFVQPLVSDDDELPVVEAGISDEQLHQDQHR